MIYNVNIQKHILNPKGKILDIGCGHHPFIRDDIDITYIDKYPYKNVSRKSDLVEVKNVIQMDAENMSFSDKEFDFIIAGDVLEHTRYPGKACREIMRVGKAGWVRCPTVLWECLFGREYHFWATNLIDEVLVFYPIDKYFKSWQYREAILDKLSPETLHCSFRWRDNFKFKIL